MKRLLTLGLIFTAMNFATPCFGESLIEYKSDWTDVQNYTYQLATEKSTRPENYITSDFWQNVLDKPLTERIFSLDPEAQTGKGISYLAARMVDFFTASYSGLPVADVHEKYRDKGLEFIAWERFSRVLSAY